LKEIVIKGLITELSKDMNVYGEEKWELRNATELRKNNKKIFSTSCLFIYLIMGALSKLPVWRTVRMSPP
jgi:hypothetical protein